MGGKQSAYGNAAAEGFFSNLEYELAHRCDVRTWDQAHAAIFDYIEAYFNRRRPRPIRGDRTPDEVEQGWGGE